MRNIINFIKSLSLIEYFFALAILGYFPILVFGYFIQDDFTIRGLTDLNFFEAVKTICHVNNNRPLSCFYHALLSRLFPNFQVYFLFSLFLYFIFIYTVFRIYDFILDDIYIKKIFLTFLIFPFFSYTIIYSPGMQSMGIVSLIFWAISLLFLKRYIYRFFFLDLFLCYFFLVIMFLIYESAVPLLGISLFFPLFFKNKKKIFFINIFLTFLILILIYFLQKEIFPNLFNQDLSRIKLSLQDYKKIIYLIIINLVLTVNIFFHSLELFTRSLYNIFISINLILLLQLLLVIFFFYLSIDNNKKKKESKSDYYFLSISIISIISVFILNALMHSVAHTGLEFTQYNNRALVSISFIFSLSVVLLYKFDVFRTKFLPNFFYITIFTLFSVNFFFFQNNLIRERFLAQELLRDEKELINKNFFLDSKYKYNVNYFIYDRSDVEEILSYNSLDFFRSIEKRKNYVNILLTENKFCNINYYDLYIKNQSANENRLNLFYYSNKKLIILSEDISNKDFRNNVGDIIKCNYKEVSDQSSKIVEKKIYLDKRFDSLFLKVIKKIYFIL